MVRMKFESRAKITVLLLLTAIGTGAHSAETFHATRFSIAVEGKGADVIMIPGLASSSDVWRPEADKLKSSYRLHLVQVAGFAGSDTAGNARGPIVEPLVEELAEYIRSNKLKQPSVIGHSLGGILGFMLVDRHPELVGKLMIVDSLPFFGLLMGPRTTVENVKPQATAMRDALMAGTQTSFAASEPAAMARLIKSKNAEADKAIAAASASDHEVVARAMYEDLMTDVRNDLPTIKTPIVVLYAFDAATGPPQSAVDTLYESAYSQLPNKRIVRVDNSFHFIQIDQPDAFHREVTQFLNAH